MAKIERPHISLHCAGPDSEQCEECPYQESRDEKKIKELIEEIWNRARINAFAHKVASEEFWEKYFRYRMLQVSLGMGSILFTILVYFAASNRGLYNEQASYNNYDGFSSLFIYVVSNYIFTYNTLSIIVTLLSILCTCAAFVIDVLLNESRLSSSAEEHRFYMNSYQYIAQRARECFWPGRPLSDGVELLKDLERDFQLMKARGPEPSDAHFLKAAKLFEKIGRDPVTGATQSFPQKQADVKGQRQQMPQQVMAVKLPYILKAIRKLRLRMGAISKRRKP